MKARCKLDLIFAQALSRPCPMNERLATPDKEAIALLEPLPALH
jgi:hypothetical protein